MNYTTLNAENQESEVWSQKKMFSLYEVYRQMIDGRKARGRRYDLAGLLVVLVLAKLAGMSSVLGASEWAKDQEVCLSSLYSHRSIKSPTLCEKLAFDLVRLL